MCLRHLSIAIWGKRGKMLEFETQSGNIYAWDDEIGISIPFSPILRAVLNTISYHKTTSRDIIVENLKDQYNEEDIMFYYNWIKKWRSIRSQDIQNSGSLDIKSFVLRNCLLQLTLSVTEDCNFRCKYCVYSDKYNNTRNQSNKYMKSTTAKKAIDQYMSLLKEGERYNPLRSPSIAFYGGEPLLNFKLIKTCVEYIEEKYNNHSVDYILTTNGSLLDKAKAKWLVQHDFSIGVSLDGPEKVHDRNRVYSNGKGTFKDIMDNIRPIMEAGYEKLRLQAVFDWKCDLLATSEFFNRNDVPRLTLATMVSATGGSRYYDQFSNEDFIAFKKQLEWAKDCYIMNLKQPEKQQDLFLDKLFLESIARYIFGTPSLCALSQIRPFTAACIPGRKIYVDVYGTFHMCERIGEIFPIGNVDEGLNFDKIGNILSDYLKHMDKCPTCNVQRACDKCYQAFETVNGFSYSSKVCKGFESARAKSLGDAFTIAEINPKVIEMVDAVSVNTKKFC